MQLEVADAGVSRAGALKQGDARLATVVENRILTAPGAPVKRHIGAFGLISFKIYS